MRHPIQHCRHVSRRVCRLQERDTTMPRYAACPKQRRRTMSATNDINMRRAVSATATGAAGTLLMSPGKADDGSLKQRGPYRIEGWGKTWMNPSRERVLASVAGGDLRGIG